MTSRERVLAVLHGQIPDRPPWLEVGFHTSIVGKIIGRPMPNSNSGFHPCSDLKAYEVELDGLIENAQKIGLDTIWLKHWILVSFAGEKGTAFDSGTIKSMEDWERAKATAAPESDSAWYRCVELFVKKVRKTDLAMGFMASLGFHGPLNAMGFQDFCIGVIDNPELVTAIHDWFAERCIQINRDFKPYQPDLVVLGDDIAYRTGPVVSPEHFRTLFLPRMKRVAESCPFPWVYHSDGNLMPVMDDLLTLGMAAIHPIEPYGTMDIVEVKRKYGKRVILVGNLDMNLIANGKPDDIRREVRRLFREVGTDGRWMLSSSNSIDSGASMANVLTMGETIKSLRYPRAGK